MCLLPRREKVAVRPESPGLRVLSRDAIIWDGRQRILVATFR